MDFYKFLNRILDSGQTLRDVAAMTGVSFSTIYRIANHETSPMLCTCDKILKAYHKRLVVMEEEL